MGTRTLDDLTKVVSDAPSLVNALAEWTGEEIVFRLHTSGEIWREVGPGVMHALQISDHTISHRVGSLRTKDSMVEVAALDAWVLTSQLRTSTAVILAAHGHSRPLGSILKDQEAGFYRETLEVAPLDRADLSGQRMCLEVRAVLMHQPHPLLRETKPCATVRERLYSSLLEF